MDRDRIRAIKERAEGDLLRLPGVTGVDIGEKMVGGRKTGQLAIIVYVEKKGRFAPEHAIPAMIEGVPTDVVERRFIRH